MTQIWRALSHPFGFLTLLLAGFLAVSIVPSAQGRLRGGRESVAGVETFRITVPSRDGYPLEVFLTRIFPSEGGNRVGSRCRTDNREGDERRCCESAHGQIEESHAVPPRIPH